MTGHFVTGTDTNVGKTVLSALLVAALDAVYWKPVQTGAIEGTDRESVRAWAEIPEERLPLERYRFNAPVSPHLASREEKVRIDLDAFELPNAEASHSHKWIVEGAGGVLVPLNERDLMRDLMRRIGFPVVIAARTALGTINHTLLTLAALREANLLISGVVMIGDRNDENRLAIERYGEACVIGYIPILPKIDRSTLLNVYEKHFDHQALA